jgi:diguanylate cyclase (GGDEF)-like protein/PAS domain S-box-containing protein
MWAGALSAGVIREREFRSPTLGRNDGSRSLGVLRSRIVLSLIGLNAIIAALIALFLIDYDANERRHAWTDAENLSTALHSGLDGTFSQIDLVLQAAADEYRRQLASGGVDNAALQAFLDRQAVRLPQTAGLRVVGANGDMLYASFQGAPKGVSVADREYFRQLKDNPDAGLVISKPEFGRLIKSQIAVFGRRLTAADGAFAGEALISLPIDDLERMFSSFDVGPHGVVSLLNYTPATVARFPEIAKRDGVAPEPHPSPQLSALLASGRSAATYRSTSGADGVARTYFFRRMARFPLFLVVGLADSDYGANWRAVAMHLAVLYGLFLLASIFSGVMIYARAATQACADSQSRLAASVYENSSEGMMIVDVGRRIVDVNRSFTALTGFSAEEARGRKISRLLSIRRDVGIVAGAARALRSSAHWGGELWLLRKDGEPFLARISISTVDGHARAAKYVALFSDATEQKRTQEMIWRHANFDTVTELPNRRHFCDSLRAEIVKAEATKSEVAVIFVDLDRFKDVNDLYGHAVGDKLLQQAADRIRACVRANDLVARLGGDEFTVLLRDVENEASVERLARRILATLARPYTLAGALTFNSASLGATLYPRDGADVETLLRNADQAMYAAKRAGRNRLQIFAPTLQVGAAARANLASDLHGALAKHEIELHYQPIVEIESGRVLEAEALARWRHPRLGVVAPSEFIPIAEETGLIVEIGDWVFRRAVAQALRWRRAFDPQFRISVNVSAVQLAAQDGAAANFDRLVARPGLGEGAIIIEITESVLIDASESIRKLFARYRRAGIAIALDDFGTGYSSLAYLKDFDINYLKADRAFVSSLTEGSREYAICEAVVAMAHKLGICVIAEGVESETQRALLAAAGCDCAQGYLYARPMPAEEFEATFFGERRALIA